MQPRRKLAPKSKTTANDLSFPPPYQQQARYIELANLALSRNGSKSENLVSIDAEKRFRTAKSKKAA
jgi:hypothetical protein